MATVPYLIGFLGNCGSALLILPQRVELCERERTQSVIKRNKTTACVCECVCVPVNPPSAMLNMKRDLAFFFSSVAPLAAVEVAPPSLLLSPF